MYIYVYMEHLRSPCNPASYAQDHELGPATDFGSDFQYTRRNIIRNPHSKAV